MVDVRCLCLCPDDFGACDHQRTRGVYRRIQHRCDVFGGHARGLTIGVDNFLDALCGRGVDEPCFLWHVVHEPINDAVVGGIGGDHANIVAQFIDALSCHTGQLTIQRWRNDVRQGWVNVFATHNLACPRLTTFAEFSDEVVVDTAFIVGHIIDGFDLGDDVLDIVHRHAVLDSGHNGMDFISGQDVALESAPE